MLIYIYVCMYSTHTHTHVCFCNSCWLFSSAYAGSSLCYANEHFDQFVFWERGVKSSERGRAWGEESVWKANNILRRILIKRKR